MGIISKLKSLKMRNNTQILSEKTRIKQHLMIAHDRNTKDEPDYLPS